MITNVNPKTIGAVKELASVKVDMNVEFGIAVDYRLLKAEFSESVYFISVNDGEDLKTVLAGNNIADAKALFEMLVSGEVTPCTAEDVAADILMSKRL